MTAIQVKDTQPAGITEEGGWAATGDGVVDWPALYPLFAATPADHLVVEHDEPADWRNIARRSIDYLRKLHANASTRT
jgi:sugar phosphate isomerase/epimerase